MSNTKKLKREHPHKDVSSTHKCKKCGKPIKTRLTIQKKTPPTLCYNHWRTKNE